MYSIKRALYTIQEALSKENYVLLQEYYQKNPTFNQKSTICYSKSPIKRALYSTTREPSKVPYIQSNEPYMLCEEPHQKVSMFWQDNNIKRAKCSIKIALGAVKRAHIKRALNSIKRDLHGCYVQTLRWYNVLNFVCERKIGRDINVSASVCTCQNIQDWLPGTITSCSSTDTQNCDTLQHTAAPCNTYIYKHAWSTTKQHG